MMHNIYAMGRMIKQLNYILDSKQKRTCVGVFLSMVISSALELLGVSAIYPFLQMMLSPAQIRDKWYVAWIWWFDEQISDRTVLLLLGVCIIFIYLFKNVFMIVGAYIRVAFAAKFQRELSIKMLSAYMEHPYEYFLNTNSSEVLRGIGSDVVGVHQILLNFFTLVAEILTIIVLGIFLFMTDPFMTIGAMILAFACLLAIVIGFKDKTKRAGKNARDAIKMKSQYGYQAVTGIKEIMVLDRKQKFIDQYNEAAFLEQKAVTVNGVVEACPDRILEGVCIGGIIGIVCIRIASGVELETFIPILGTFGMAAFKILPSISKIATRINALVYHHLAIQETYHNIKEANEYNKELQRYVLDTTDFKENEARDIRFSNEIRVDHIMWKYLNAKDNVLQNTSLTIKKGQSVALIGSSGAGKTTLADIIMGLLKPQSGTVYMDGIDIFTIPHQWVRIIGYVPQAVFLIDDTVRSNVAFGLKKDEINDEKVWEALRQAQLKEFVENLPFGLDTIVGERGVKFSGGQRQRIAIARALYENPDILVLDEATSALDNETETAVMESIDALQGSKTLIIVAHRLTTIRNCDVIYEIKDGVAVRREKDEVLAGI